MNWPQLGAIVISLFLCSTLQAQDGSGEPRPTPACASLTGAWYGTFAGGFGGAWGANFEHTEASVTAAATIVVDGVGELQAYGNAIAACKDGITSFTGSGTAGGRSGSFSGSTDRGGNKVSGAWEGAGRSGTWRGEREEREQ